jgi:hypothetical protein
VESAPDPARHLEADDAGVRPHIADHEKSREHHQDGGVAPEQDRGDHGEPGEAPQIRGFPVVPHQHAAGFVIMEHLTHDSAIDQLVEMQRVGQSGRLAPDGLAIDGKQSLPNWVDQQQHGKPR